MSKRESKTNAVRIVENSGTEYQMHTYDVSDGMTDGKSVAEKLGQNPAQVFKTLVLAGHSKEHYVCVVPVEYELDLKKAARHFSEKNIEMIHQKELLPLTGYIHGGCSPIGMKKQFQTAFHESAREFDTVYVSGGRVGLQIELRSEDLVKLTDGAFADLTKE